MLLKRNIIALCVALSAAGTSVNAASVSDLERQVRASEQARVIMQQRLEEMEMELNAANGRLEEANNAIRELQKNQQDMYRQIDALKSQLASAASSKPQTQTSQQQSSGDSKETVQAPNDGSDKTAYQNAVNLIMVDKNYPGACQAFKNFISKYPNSLYLSNAYFWLGEAYMKQKKYTEAKQNFLVVIKDSSSNKRAESLYKLGVISNNEKNTDYARKFFSLVVRDYAGTTTAKLAQNELDKLK
jgi:tol-pal system protein YbgF